MTHLPLQRWSAVLLLVLAAVAGFAVRAVGVPSSESAAGRVEVAQREAAVDFYAALNVALSGGPGDELNALLSPIFVDHASDTGETRETGAFLEDVRAAGSSGQGARIEVLGIEPAGNSLVVNVRPARAETVSVAGMSIAQAPAGPHLEVLRVDRGKIVDRWAPDFSWIDVSTLDERAPKISSSAGIATTLVRIALDGSREQSWKALGIGLVLVEQGSVLLEINDRFGASTVRQWESGEFASVPSGAQARLRSADGTPASVLVYLATHVGASDIPLPVQWGNSASLAGARTVLWSGQLLWQGTDISHQPVRIVLPVGAAVELTPPMDAALLLAGDGGAVQVSSAGGSVEVLGDDRWPQTVEGVVQLDADRAASISGGDGVMVRNMADSRVSLLVMVIEESMAHEGGEVREE
jgi:hypothetical protein